MAEQRFATGIVEGFYGHPWSWQQRAEMVDFLSREGLSLYVYAPKADGFLRRNWREPLPDGHFEQLRRLRRRAAERGVQFGLGLSPWGLQKEYGAKDAAVLRAKVEALNALDPDWLCMLFDDMPGEGDGIARRQAAIVGDAVAVSTARRFAMCPTWYSDDPQLEQLFGAMPPSYLTELGSCLAASVEVFWTGPQVVSTSYHATDMVSVSTALGRRPLLWDNYPVNDGRRISRFLHVWPLSGRPRRLRAWCTGHLLNPMNQPLLSRPAIASLSALYRGDFAPGLAPSRNDDALVWWRGRLPQLIGAATAEYLCRDAELFQQQGLDAIDADRRSALVAAYRALGEAAADEVADWLDERYRFDPACLND